MTVLRALRLLILGETWTPPAGVVAVLAAGVALRAVAPDHWRSAGGFALLAGVVLVLTLSVSRGSREPG